MSKAKWYNLTDDAYWDDYYRMAWSLALIFTIFIAGILFMATQNTERDITAKHCEQYKVIPEEHLDRVPDGCITYYFEDRP